MSITRKVIAIALLTSMLVPQIALAAEVSADNELISEVAISEIIETEVEVTEPLVVAVEESVAVEEIVETLEPESVVVEQGQWHGARYQLLNGTQVHNSWLKEREHWYYFNAAGELAVGWHKIDGHWYYFKTSGGSGERGRMHKGFLVLGDQTYYLSEHNSMEGRMLTGWQKVNGHWYYFVSGDNGEMLTGWQKFGDRWYYLNSTANEKGQRGKMLTGWHDISGQRYYLMPGDNGQMLTGWQKIDGAWYYMRPGDNGQLLAGWHKLGASWYYLNRAANNHGKVGQMLTGWHDIDGQRYYLMPGDNGQMLTGWQIIGGRWHYFRTGDNGQMLRGWQHIGGTWYYLESDGKMKVGWHTDVDGKLYFLHTVAHGNEGAMATGIKAIESKTYYFKANGECTGEVSPDYIMEVCRNIIYAVETGGQVYGNKRYDDFTQAYHNTPNEHAITIGAGQWYATEARRLLVLIRNTDPVLFNHLDVAGIGWDLDNADWSRYQLLKDSEKAKCIVAIINTDVGRRCQDQLMNTQIKEFFSAAEKLGITDPGAKIQYVNVAHLGGSSVAKLVVEDAQQPYTAQSMYDAIMRRNVGNQVGGALYRTRHEKVQGWIRQYL